MAEKKQSLAGIVRQRLGEIETKLEHGFNYESILDDLNTELDKDISLGHFKTLLHRARLRRIKNKEGSPPPSQEQKRPSEKVANNEQSKPNSTRQSLEAIIQNEPNLNDYSTIAKGK